MKARQRKRGGHLKPRAQHEYAENRKWLGIALFWGKYVSGDLGEGPVCHAVEPGLHSADDKGYEKV